MACMKTAISIQESLFKEAEALAAKMNLSRSQLFAIAMSEFIQRQKNQQLLEQINVAYNDMPEALEKERQQSMKVKQRELLEGQW
jgi:metal-responsive CopG/Arc/MetJ family transcriptional regulator